MRCLAFMFFTLLLVNCCNGSPLGVAPGAKYNIVVLAKEPVDLHETSKVFRGDQPMQVVGEQAMVCLVLRGDVKGNETDELFKQLMGQARVGITIKLKAGETIELSEPMQGWSRSGTVLKSSELVGCASDCCEGRLSKGTEIEEVTIKSSIPLRVEGIYWQSTDAYDGLGKK